MSSAGADAAVPASVVPPPGTPDAGPSGAAPLLPDPPRMALASPGTNNAANAGSDPDDPPRHTRMDRTERFHLIDRLLAQKKLVTKREFLDELEVSLATFKRDLEYLRDRIGAPIEWNAERRGYEYRAKAGDRPFQLPGLWFNPSEIEALLTMHAMLDEMQPERDDDEEEL